MKIDDGLFILPQEFARQIEDIVWEKDISYIDAVLMWGGKFGIDPVSVSGLIKKSPNLKAKIQEEAENTNCLKKTNRLPL